MYFKYLTTTLKNMSTTSHLTSSKIYFYNVPAVNFQQTCSTIIYHAENHKATVSICFIVKDQVKFTGEVHITIYAENLKIDTEKLMKNFHDDFQEIYEIICWTEFPNEE